MPGRKIVGSRHAKSTAPPARSKFEAQHCHQHHCQALSNSGGCTGRPTRTTQPNLVLAYAGVFYRRAEVQHADSVAWWLYWLPQVTIFEREHVRVLKDAGAPVATAWLTRPAKRNALSPAVLADIEVHRCSISVVVGEGSRRGWATLDGGFLRCCLLLPGWQSTPAVLNESVAS